MSIKVLRAAAGLAFALGLGLLLYGFAFNGDGSTDAQAAPESTTTAVVTNTPAATSTPSSTKTAEPSPTETEIPTATPTPFDGAVARFLIPRFDVDAAVENIGIDDKNRLEVPDDPLNVGWYGIYQKPGWGYNAVFSAHVDYFPDIKGPFYDLARSEVGDEIIVVMENGIEYKYRVISNVRYTVDTIPTGDLIKAPDRPRDKEWITLITCGGTFVPYNGYDGPGYYVHRDVVIAERFE